MKKHLIDKYGNIVPHQSVIRWHVWDNDDYTLWVFTGIVVDRTQLSYPFKGNDQYVVYLGGGVDFGAAIGKHIDFETVSEQAENNDEDTRGIEVVGKASPSQLADWIGKFKQ